MANLSKSIKTYDGRVLTIVRTVKRYICINPIKNTHGHKWIWEAEDGSEWTPMCGEWRKVIDHKHWYTGTVLGQEASDFYMDRAVNA